LAALCVYAIGYRLYSAFIAAKALALDDRRVTPAHAYEDGHNYVPSPKWVLFGHHFAAIAGAGPLVGPTLAAQFGFAPGFLWILIGAVLAGCVQDFMVLVLINVAWRCWQTLHGVPIPQEAFGPPPMSEDMPATGCC
jgi:carbon starvation protein